VVGHDCTPEQEALFREMLQKPASDPDRFGRVWATVHGLDGAYPSE